MDAKKLERLNELRKLDTEKQAQLSHRKYENWTLYSSEYGELIDLNGEERREADRSREQAHKNDWENDPATQRQYDYIDDLNVDLNGRKLTKIQASRIIDAVKSGNGVGQFGLEFYGGSN
jgi:hypothetical protein